MSERTTSHSESFPRIFCQRCHLVTIAVAFAVATAIYRSRRRRRLHRHHRRRIVRVASSRRVEALGPGSRIKFANGIYILAHFRQPARSMTHLRDTERRHLCPNRLTN